MRNTITRHTITYTYRASNGDNREATYTVTSSHKLTHRAAQRIIDREIIGVRPTVTKIDSIAYA